MSQFFKFFPVVDYQFGTDAKDGHDHIATFEDITAYAEVVDQVVNNITSYETYYLLPGEQPYQVSQKLYGTPNYHWTFYLMNTKVRETGWPLSPQQLFELAQEKYNVIVITTKTKLTDKFKVGQTIEGATSEATAVIEKRNLDLGQLFLKNVSGTFISGENITSTNSDGILESINATSAEFAYNAAHHYENAEGHVVDIDPEVGPGAQLTEVTWLNRIERINDDKRQLKVIKGSIISQVAKSFRDAISS